MGRYKFCKVVWKLGLKPYCTQKWQKLYVLGAIGIQSVIGLKGLIDFSVTVKAATLIFISGRGSAISYAKEGKSGSINNFVKN